MFEHLLEIARRERVDLLELARRTGCGTGCGMCVPYIRIALRTGQSTLPVLSAKEFRELVAQQQSR